MSGATARHGSVDATGAQAPLGRTLRLLRPERARIGLAVGLGAAAVASAIGLLATSAWLVSRASQRPSIVALGVAVVAVRFLALSRGLLRYGERLVGHSSALRLLADLRVRAFERLERLAPAGLPAFQRGDLLARLVGDVDSLQDLALRVVVPVAVAVLVGAVTVVAVGWLLPAAGVILAVALVAAATLVPWLTGALARRSERTQQAARADLAVAVVDLLEGAPDLVAFGATARVRARVEQADGELTRVAASSAATAGLGQALVQLATGLAVWGAVVVGVPAVGGGSLDPVLLAVVVLVPLAAFEAVAGLPAAAQALAQSRRAAARVLGVLGAPDPVPEPTSPPPRPAGPGHVVLRGVTARYPGGPAVLAGIDLDLAPGRRIAVVGPSGAGKSTLAAMLVRFLPYEAGSITLDGVELANLAGDDVRRTIGLVEQDAHVFDTTLGENLRLGRRQISDAELVAVLGRVGLGGWLASLPRGLDTGVGEHGTHLSGGQRRRLAVARVLLAEPAVLVLDEPTEHLDGPAADALLADLLSVTHGHTTVLVTHRLSGLDALDEIVVLDHGRVVERGRPAELMGAAGTFARF